MITFVNYHLLRFIIDQANDLHDRFYHDRFYCVVVLVIVVNVLILYFTVRKIYLIMINLMRHNHAMINNGFVRM